MPELDELIATEVAGRPLGQWALIVAAGVALGLVALKRLRPEQAGGLGPDPITGLRYGTEPIGGLSVGQDFALPSGVQPSTASPDETNADWLGRAFDALKGSFDSASIDTALRKYLNGQPLTESEYRIVSRALSTVGLPPDGAPSIDRVSTGTAPKTTTTVSPIPTTTTTRTTTTRTTTTTATRTASSEATLSDMRRLLDDASKMAFAYGGRIDAPDVINLGRLVGVTVTRPVTVGDVDRVERQVQASASIAKLRQLKPIADRLGLSYGGRVDPIDAINLGRRLRVSVSYPVTNADVDRLIAAA